MLEEQIAAVPVVSPRIDAVLDRMGDHLPTQFTTVAAYQSFEQLVSQGTQEQAIIGFGFSSFGVSTLEFDIAATIAGIPACEEGSGVETSEALGSGFSFAAWLAQDSRWPLGEEPMDQWLLSASDDEVLTWYSAHEAKFLSCTRCSRMA